MDEPTYALADYDLTDVDLPVGLAVLGGALLGGIAGFLFLTARGTRARRDISRTIDRAFHELDTLLESWGNVQQRAAHARGDTAGRPAHASRRSASAFSKETSTNDVP